MATHTTVYDHIRDNNIKTFLLILLFPLSLLLLVFLAILAGAYMINDPEFMMSGVLMLKSIFPSMKVTAASHDSLYITGAIGMTLYTATPIIVMALAWMAIAYMTGDKMMLKQANAQKAKSLEDKKVYQAIENVAIMTGLPIPQAYIIEENSLNAFATGRDPSHASVAVTRGLINKLEMDELEAVIAHEMAHIKNRDVRLTMLIITGLGVFGLLAGMMRHANYNISRGGNNKNKGQLQLLVFLVIIALTIFNYIVAPMIRLAVSRTREHAADATGALIVRNPKALASALRKISQNPIVESVQDDKDMAAAFIANPMVKFKELTSTHPPIEERIKRLEKM